MKILTCVPDLHSTAFAAILLTITALSPVYGALMIDFESPTTTGEIVGQEGFTGGGKSSDQFTVNGTIDSPNQVLQIRGPDGNVQNGGIDRPVSSTELGVADNTSINGVLTFSFDLTNPLFGVNNDQPFSFILAGESDEIVSGNIRNGGRLRVNNGSGDENLSLTMSSANLSFVADFTTQTYDVFENTTKLNTSPLGFRDAATGFTIFSFSRLANNTSSNTNEMYIDNISASVIPEPSSFALILVSLVSTLVFLRRR